MLLETAPDPWTVKQVALNMRERDFAEYCASTGHKDRALLANLLVGRYARRADVIVAGDADEPIVIAGAIEVRPHVCSMLFFATPAIERIGLAVTKAAKRVCDDCFANGAHRIECISMADYPQMQRWLVLLGFTPEFRMKMWGCGGEDFVQFARTRRSALAGCGRAVEG